MEIWFFSDWCMLYIFYHLIQYCRRLLVSYQWSLCCACSHTASSFIFWNWYCTSSHSSQYLSLVSKGLRIVWIYFHIVNRILPFSFLGETSFFSFGGCVRSWVLEFVEIIFDNFSYRLYKCYIRWHSYHI